MGPLYFEQIYAPDCFAVDVSLQFVSIGMNVDARRRAMTSAAYRTNS